MLGYKQDVFPGPVEKDIFAVYFFPVQLFISMGRIRRMNACGFGCQLEESWTKQSIVVLHTFLFWIDSVSM